MAGVQDCYCEFPVSTVSLLVTEILLTSSPIQGFDRYPGQFLEGDHAGAFPNLPVPVSRPLADHPRRSLALRRARRALADGRQEGRCVLGCRGFVACIGWYLYQCSRARGVVRVAAVIRCSDKPVAARVYRFDILSRFLSRSGSGSRKSLAAQAWTISVSSHPFILPLFYNGGYYTHYAASARDPRQGTSYPLSSHPFHTAHRYGRAASTPRLDLPNPCLQVFARLAAIYDLYLPTSRSRYPL